MTKSDVRKSRFLPQLAAFPVGILPYNIWYGKVRMVSTQGEKMKNENMFIRSHSTEYTNVTNRQIHRRTLQDGIECAYA